jgi:hypothetical protein
MVILHHVHLEDIGLQPQYLRRQQDSSTLWASPVNIQGNLRHFEFELAENPLHMYVWV